MINPALKAQAEALGITVPGNWGDKRIQEEIEKVQGQSQTDAGQVSAIQQAPTIPEKKEKDVEIVLKAAFWPEEGVRKEIGEKVTVPLSKAKQLIQQGKAEIPLSEE